MQKRYDVIIVGGGITGCALLYTLSRYTSIKSILLLEKYDALAMLNSSASSNSQTLHFGDIETNYTKEHSLKTKEDAERVLYYARRLHGDAKRRIIMPVQKMVLGVGSEEVEGLEKGYHSWLKNIFPGLSLLGKKELERIEPNVVNGRDKREEIGALLSDKGYMVNFGLLAKQLAKDARVRGKKIDIILGARVIEATPRVSGYKVLTNKGEFYGGFVEFASGSYSLYFAKSMGYDKGLTILSIGGNFFYSKKVLRGKVYRVQKGGIPFAAVHGDPDITRPGITRFGPTVTVPLELEKGHPETFTDYMKVFDFNEPTFESISNILFNKDIESILRRNAVYALPEIGRYEFLKMEAGVIVPSLKVGDLHFASGTGGIRPQIIDEKKRNLLLGASKLYGDNVVFNITPSPGASSALGSGLEDSILISKTLGAEMLREKYEKEMGPISKSK
ncbi:MAG: FAD-dependent oxidoreductase [Candidatus Marsarchaeota archaeon]|nr:FAD-dependent oxidoreductase [Candidatus Marsarchaeota archaeon]MCL5112510.1 FAD-dependent oxidoreductase [Candidatus Marsarchaeota archaeon]